MRRKYVDCADLTFVVLEEHRDFAIDAKIKRAAAGARIIALPAVTEGAAITALRGAEGLPDGEPLLFNDCDHLFLCRSFNDFCNKGDFAHGPDGALLTFTSDSPAYSYLQYGPDGNVCHTVRWSSTTPSGAPAQMSTDLRRRLRAYLKNCEYKESFRLGIYNVLADRGAPKRRASPQTCTCPSAPRPSTAPPRPRKTNPLLRNCCKWFFTSYYRSFLCWWGAIRTTAGVNRPVCEAPAARPDAAD